jgi:predicted transcriptional regulator
MKMITPDQCRAARAWLNISQTELAKAAGVSEATIRKFERREGSPMRGTVLLIHTAIERLGIEIGTDSLTKRA